MKEGLITEVKWTFDSVDDRVPLFRVDACYGGERGPGLSLVVLDLEFLQNKNLRKVVIEDLRKLLVKVENYKGQQ